MRLPSPAFRSPRQKRVHVLATEAVGIGPIGNRDSGALEGVSDILQCLFHGGMGQPVKDSLQYDPMAAKRQDSRPFGKNLRMERLRLGLNQSDLAEIGGVSKATQVAYEADSTKPDANYLSRVSEAGVDVLWLLTGRHATLGVQWELLFDLLALIDEWVGERNKPTSTSERNDLLRTLYAQFCADNRIDAEQMRATFRLVK